MWRETAAASDGARSRAKLSPLATMVRTAKPAEQQIILHLFH
jgi:hypothetical protein